jgi:hypothetical protein
MTLSQQLREAGEKATPGYWEWTDFPEITVDGVTAIIDCSKGDSEDENDANAALIVLLRNNLDRLIEGQKLLEALPLLRITLSRIAVHYDRNKADGMPDYCALEIPLGDIRAIRDALTTVNTIIAALEAQEAGK